MKRIDVTKRELGYWGKDDTFEGRGHSVAEAVGRCICEDPAKYDVEIVLHESQQPTREQ